MKPKMITIVCIAAATGVAVWLLGRPKDTRTSAPHIVSCIGISDQAAKDSSLDSRVNDEPKQPPLSNRDHPSNSNPTMLSDDKTYAALAIVAVINAGYTEAVNSKPVITRMPDRIVVTFPPQSKPENKTLLQGDLATVFIDPKTNTVTHTLGQGD